MAAVTMRARRQVGPLVIDHGLHTRAGARRRARAWSGVLHRRAAHGRVVKKFRRHKSGSLSRSGRRHARQHVLDPFDKNLVYDTTSGSSRDPTERLHRRTSAAVRRYWTHSMKVDRPSLSLQSRSCGRPTRPRGCGAPGGLFITTVPPWFTRARDTMRPAPARTAALRNRRRQFICCGGISCWARRHRSAGPWLLCFARASSTRLPRRSTVASRFDGPACLRGGGVGGRRGCPRRDAPCLKTGKLKLGAVRARRPAPSPTRGSAAVRVPGLPSFVLLLLLPRAAAPAAQNPPSPEHCALLLLRLSYGGFHTPGVPRSVRGVR